MKKATGELVSHRWPSELFTIASGRTVRVGYYLIYRNPNYDYNSPLRDTHHRPEVAAAAEKRIHAH